MRLAIPQRQANGSFEKIPTFRTGVVSVRPYSQTALQTHPGFSGYSYVSCLFVCLFAGQGGSRTTPTPPPPTPAPCLKNHPKPLENQQKTIPRGSRPSNFDGSDFREQQRTRNCLAFCHFFNNSVQIVHARLYLNLLPHESCVVGCPVHRGVTVT